MYVTSAPNYKIKTMNDNTNKKIPQAVWIMIQKKFPLNLHATEVEYEYNIIVNLQRSAARIGYQLAQQEIIKLKDSLETMTKGFDGAKETVIEACEQRNKFYQETVDLKAGNLALLTSMQEMENRIVKAKSDLADEKTETERLKQIVYASHRI